MSQVKKSDALGLGLAAFLVLLTASPAQAAWINCHVNSCTGGWGRCPMSISPCDWEWRAAPGPVDGLNNDLPAPQKAALSALFKKHNLKSTYQVRILTSDEIKNLTATTAKKNQKTNISENSEFKVEHLGKGTFRVTNKRTKETLIYEKRVGTGWCTPPHRASWCDLADILL